jgi:hypothetical protein
LAAANDKDAKTPTNHLWGLLVCKVSRCQLHIKKYACTEKITDCADYTDFFTLRLCAFARAFFNRLKYSVQVGFGFRWPMVFPTMTANLFLQNRWVYKVYKKAGPAVIVKFARD